MTFRVVLWLFVAFVLYLTAAFWIADRAAVCVSSMMVSVGEDPVVNPVTCSE